MAIEIVNRKRRYRVVLRIHRKKVSKSFERKLDAEEWERRMLVGRDDGESPLLPPRAKQGPLSLNEFRKRFEREYAQTEQARSTQITEAGLYRKHVSPYLGGAEIRGLGKQELDEYFTILAQTVGASRNKITRLRTLLHGMFAQAVYWQLITSNPVSAGRTRKRGEKFREQVIGYLSQEETTGLLNWLSANDPWLYPQVCTLVNTGLRYGELLALRPEDVVPSPDGAKLMVSRTYCHHTYEVRNRTKGGSSRVIPLSNSMSGLLLSVAGLKRSGEPLFRESWELCRHATKFRKHFETAMKASKVRRIRIHDLRHTFAVHFLERGGNIYDLRNLLGHSTIQLTERYSHFSQAMIERSRGLVDHHADAKMPVENGEERCVMSHKSPTKSVFPQEIPIFIVPKIQVIN